MVCFILVSMLQKNKHDISVLTDTGETLFSLSNVANTTVEAQRFLTVLEKHKVPVRDCIVEWKLQDTIGLRFTHFSSTMTSQ